jgi:hypothetical protein
MVPSISSRIRSLRESVRSWIRSLKGGWQDVLACLPGFAGSDAAPSSANQLDDEDGYRNHQQHVDIPHHHVETNKADQPQNKQDDEDSPKHLVCLPGRLGSGVVPEQVFRCSPGTNGPGVVCCGSRGIGCRPGLVLFPFLLLISVPGAASGRSQSIVCPSSHG